MENSHYSLREAAKAVGRSEDQLRRAILMGELVATPVDDDRQYIIDAKDLPSFRGPSRVPVGLPRPRCRERFLCLSAFAVVCVLSVGPLLLCLLLGVAQRAEYYCGNCARELHTSRLGHVLVVSHRTRESALTPWIRERGGRPCVHEWISFRAGHKRWARLLEWKAEGVLDSARDVDPFGAVEFVRWALRHDLPETISREPIRFSTEEEFHAWVEKLRSSVAPLLPDAGEMQEHE